jgi:hypothetical protein
MNEETKTRLPIKEETSDEMHHTSIKPVMVEILLILVLAVLGVLTLNPYWMPMGMYLTALLALTVLFALFAIVVWREQGGDERERLLIHMSDRIAFMAGAAVLLTAVVIEGLLQHMPNPWVVGALAAMVIAKAAAYIYNSSRN